MAEPDSLMRLGMEAARDGNKDEARNLFRLLTLQDPTNAQAWLWLAGVAENREERQAALERVVELDPTNEMALKRLQALRSRSGGRTAVTEPEPEPEPIPPPAPAPSPQDDPYVDEDDPFAELNNLSGVMADAEGPVRRSEPPPTTPADGDPLSEGSTVTSSRPASSRPTSSRPASSRPASIYDDDDDETVPARRGLSPLLSILLAIVGVLILGLMIAWWYQNNNQSVADQGPAAQQTAAAEATAAAAASQEPSAILGSGTNPDGSPTAPITATATLEPAAVEPTVAPTAPQADLSQVNPVIVPANTPLQSEGWLYDFNQPTYAAPIIGPLGQFTPNNGRFVVVLAFAVNTSSTSQQIPADFFVLKDGQGRIWTARPEVSDAYVIPGVNADLSHTQEIPADGITRSVALIFDVAPDATNLVFFARSNPSQGWLVLPNV